MLSLSKLFNNFLTAVSIIYLTKNCCFHCFTTRYNYSYHVFFIIQRPSLHKQKTNFCWDGFHYIKLASVNIFLLVVPYKTINSLLQTLNHFFYSLLAISFTNFTETFVLTSKQKCYNQYDLTIQTMKLFSWIAIIFCFDIKSAC